MADFCKYDYASERYLDNRVRLDAIKDIIPHTLKVFTDNHSWKPKGKRRDYQHYSVTDWRVYTTGKPDVLIVYIQAMTGGSGGYRETPYDFIRIKAYVRDRYIDPTFRHYLMYPSQILEGEGNFEICTDPVVSGSKYDRFSGGNFIGEAIGCSAIEVPADLVQSDHRYESLRVALPFTYNKSTVRQRTFEILTDNSKDGKGNIGTWYLTDKMEDPYNITVKNSNIFTIEKGSTIVYPEKFTFLANCGKLEDYNPISGCCKELTYPVITTKISKSGCIKQLLSIINKRANVHAYLSGAITLDQLSQCLTETELSTVLRHENNFRELMQDNGNEDVEDGEDLKSSTGRMDGHVEHFKKNLKHYEEIKQETEEEE